jgi:hypothetical protein
MDVTIKCTECGEMLTFGKMAKQSIKQTAKQALNWKVMLGLKKLNGYLLVKDVVKRVKKIFAALNVKAKKFGQKIYLKAEN